jgi:LmbE family N-acetylglucosaminyl deacetylase
MAVYRGASAAGDAVKRVASIAALIAFTAFFLFFAMQPKPAVAQKPAIDPNGNTLADAIEAIHKSRVATRVLFITAHPDDEASSVVTYLSRGAGDDLYMLTLTRGQGGQNAIGPEQGDQLGVIRSAELLAAAETYGAHLFFSRAPDFGFSKTLEETLKMWGDVPEDDMVRLIRAVRPEVVINGWGNVRTGHGNHQASGFLTPKAVEAAGDPSAYTAQFSQGLKPWKVELLVNLDRGQSPAGYLVPVNEVSPLRGETYSEIGRDGFVNQRSQGVVAFGNSAFLRRPAGLVAADGKKFDPADLSEPITWLAARFPAYSAAMQPALAEADGSLERANTSALSLDWPAAARELAHAGAAIENLQSKLNSQGGDSLADAQFELSRVRSHIDHALSIAAAIHILATADRSTLVDGESFNVRVEVQHRQSFPDSALDVATLQTPACWQVAPASGGTPLSSSMKVTLPADPQASCNSVGAATASHIPDSMRPFPLPLVTAHVRTTIEGYAFETSTAVFSQHATATTVTTETLRVVPAVTLTLDPDQFVVPEGRNPLESAKPLTVLIRAHSYSGAPLKASIGLDIPQGWKMTPAQTSDLEPSGDALLRFTVTPPAGLAAGNFSIKAWAKYDSQQSSTTIAPLPSLPSYLWSSPSIIPVHAFAVNVPANLRIGYIAADIDPVPDAISRLGVKVELLDPAELAFGDLHKFDAIIVGIRAYELRSDVVASNHRLLDYVNNGGTLLVEYERSNIWDDLKTAPYTATMGNATIRITDENSPVRFIDLNSPILNFPNKITMADFKGWVQERGNYFWTKWDEHYKPVLAMRDPGENEETGGLLWTRYGKGVYIYTGIEFFRQLPEGNAGAYRLFVNLISQSRPHPPAPAAASNSAAPTHGSASAPITHH